MSKIISILLVTLWLTVGTAWAGDVEDATAALVRNDYVTALTKFRRAAEKNDSSAQFNLGNMYYLGQGVAQDYAEAVRWYKLAAAQGYASAQTTLGYMFRHGQGVVQDHAETVRWYKLAAAQEDATAQSNLGQMYGEGKGVVQDNMRAHMWFNLAAVTGHANAVKNRDIVAKRMTTQQVAEAQKLARECQARNFKNCD
jgi:TPR repeat protein